MLSGAACCCRSLNYQLWWNIENICLLEPLARQDHDKYEGLLGYTIARTAMNTSDTIIKGNTEHNISMILCKTRSAFGKDTLSVWRVFLGDIQEIGDTGSPH
jgi:hypothetical protein